MGTEINFNNIELDLNIPENDCVSYSEFYDLCNCVRDNPLNTLAYPKLLIKYKRKKENIIFKLKGVTIPIRDYPEVPYLLKFTIRPNHLFRDSSSWGRILHINKNGDSESYEYPITLKNLLSDISTQQISFHFCFSHSIGQPEKKSRSRSSSQPKKSSKSNRNTNNHTKNPKNETIFNSQSKKIMKPLIISSESYSSDSNNSHEDSDPDFDVSKKTQNNSKKDKSKSSLILAKHNNTNNKSVSNKNSSDSDSDSLEDTELSEVLKLSKIEYKHTNSNIHDSLTTNLTTNLTADLTTNNSDLDIDFELDDSTIYVHNQTPYKGIKNQGATCYMNVFIQVLYHCPAFRKII